MAPWRLPQTHRLNSVGHHEIIGKSYQAGPSSLSGYLKAGRAGHEGHRQENFKIGSKKSNGGVAREVKFRTLESEGCGTQQMRLFGMDREFEIRNWEAGAVGRAWASGIVEFRRRGRRRGRGCRWLGCVGGLRSFRGRRLLLRAYCPDRTGEKMSAIILAKGRGVPSDVVTVTYSSGEEGRI